MKKLVALLVMFCGVSYGATYPNTTVRDTNGNQLQMNSNGSINVNFTSGDSMTYTYGVQSATGTFTTGLTVTGSEGIVNTYGITSATGTFSGTVSASSTTVTGFVKGQSLGCTTLRVIATAIPSFVGQIVIGTDYKIYVGSQTVTASWMGQ